VNPTDWLYSCLTLLALIDKEDGAEAMLLAKTVYGYKFGRPPLVLSVSSSFRPYLPAVSSTERLFLSVMAITRHAEYVRQLQASRQLRSCRNSILHNGKASPARHVRKSRLPLSPILRQADRRNPMSPSGQSHVPGEVDQDGGRPSGYDDSLLQERVERAVGSSRLSLT
jgi:hypothetical protein